MLAQPAPKPRPTTAHIIRVMLGRGCTSATPMMAAISASVYGGSIGGRWIVYPGIPCFATNTDGGDITALEARHRHRARVEDRIRAAKDTGLRNLPYADFASNRIWLAIVLLAYDLLAWTPPAPASPFASPPLRTPIGRHRPSRLYRGH